MNRVAVIKRTIDLTKIVDRRSKSLVKSSYLLGINKRLANKWWHRHSEREMINEILHRYQRLILFPVKGIKNGNRAN